MPTDADDGFDPNDNSSSPLESIYDGSLSESTSDELPGIDVRRIESPDSSRLGRSIPNAIGRYRPVAILGQGGMGTVYLARQEEPIKRDVALKIIKAGRDSQQVIARFDAERQALAMMNHKHIAKVYDAGIAETGSPYFVMELVDGVSVNQFCDLKKLSIEDRLKLFIDICKGVEHAHQKGVIHRDLKPSNILVSIEQGEPTVKIIDFGLAKATEQNELLVEHELTEIGQILGTIQYMSPEQAQLGSLDVDTRTDIYSLGVILYELMTGVTPLRRDTIASKGMLELLQWIQQKEPTRPSAQLRTIHESISSVSALRSTTISKLQSRVKGDLDWIIMKALEIDRARRYPSATQFASDIQCYLSNQPISARPPSTTYRIGKLVQRNRGAAAFLITLGVVLISATIISGYLAVQANSASKRSEIAKLRALDSVAAVQRLVLDSPVWKVNNPGRDSLIDLLANEYDYWAKDPDDFNTDLLSLSSAMVRLAKLEKELGRIDKSQAMANRAIEMVELQNDISDAASQLAIAEAETLFVDVSAADKGSITNSIANVEMRLAKIDVANQPQNLAEKYCEILQDVADFYYRIQDQQAFLVAKQNLSLCDQFLGKFTTSERLKFVKAKSLSRMGICAYQRNKPGGSKIDESNYEDFDIDLAFIKSIKLAEALINENYQRTETARFMAGVISNRGMRLLAFWRKGIVDKEVVEHNYDRGLGICDKLLKEFPDNLVFMEMKGLLLINKADAKRQFGDWEAEELLRIVAHQLFKSVTAQTTLKSSAGPRLTLNQSKYVLNQYRLGKNESAFRLAKELYDYELEVKPNNYNFDCLFYYLCALEDKSLSQAQREDLGRLADAALRDCLASSVVQPAENWKLLSESELLSRYRSSPDFLVDWENAKTARRLKRKQSSEWDATD